MKSTLRIIILSLSLVTLLGACAAHKHTAQNNGEEKLGTGDSGGGNLYKGRPIESYRVDITQLPSYKSKVAPIIDALTNTNNVINHKQGSNPDLGRMFMSILTKRTWFLIPGPLETLPKERTGIVVPSEQGALQSSKEIWIDSNLFNVMSEEDQATLILHEVLMGLRILKFASNRDQCLSYSLNPQYCGERTTPNGTIQHLTEKDYADVRAAGIEIFKTYTQLTYDAWDDVMARHNFSMNNREFKRLGDQGEVSTEEVIKNIKQAIVAQRGPRYGYTEYRDRVVQNQGACQVELTDMPGAGRYEVKLKTPNDSRNVVLDLSSTPKLGYSRNTLFNQVRLTEVRVSNLPAGAQVKVGDRYYSVNFQFDLSTWVGAEIIEHIITEVTDNGNTSSFSSENLKGGFHYRCLTYPVLEFN